MPSLSSPGKKTYIFPLLNKKATSARLAMAEKQEPRVCFLKRKTLQKLLRNDCFKDEHNSLPRFFFGAAIIVFLQALRDCAKITCRFRLVFSEL